MAASAAGLGGTRPGGHQARDPRLDRRHGQRDADQAGGADQDLLGGHLRGPTATSAHIRSASARPWAPVAALAFPLLTTTADGRSSVGGQVVPADLDRAGRRPGWW